MNEIIYNDREMKDFLKILIREQYSRILSVSIILKYEYKVEYS